MVRTPCFNCKGNGGSIPGRGTKILHVWGQKIKKKFKKRAVLKKSTDNKCWRGCREKGTLLHCLWECKLVQPLWRTVWRFFRKLKIELPYELAIPLMGVCPEKTLIQKDTRTPMFIAALFTIAKTWKQPKYPLTNK